MKKFTFGTPEEHVPSRYCPGFCYRETPVSRRQEDFTFRQTENGIVIEFDMAPDTQVFGFGLQLYRLNHTGCKVVIRNNSDPRTSNGESHAPVPFFVTNKGYGMYFDTARYAEFYCGIQTVDDHPVNRSQPFTAATSESELYADKGGDRPRKMSVYIPHCRGIDVYVFEGSTITEITAQYNRLSGGGCTLPEWSLGMLYRCNTRHDAAQILSTARTLREHHIPCTTLGLEPGWQTHAYSCTYRWSPERFPDPAGLVAQLREMGFHVNLWEHAFVHPDCEIHDALLPYSCDYRVWEGLVPDFALPQAKTIFADLQKKNTADLGVDGYKGDECDGSDHTGGWSFPNHARFPSGMDGEQYHNLFGTLYAQTLWQALEYRPTLCEIRNMGALAASYPFVLYSDLYDHKSFIRGVVNAGFSGLLWAPELRDAHSAEEMLRRTQTLVFSAHCLVNAWYTPRAPWLEFDCEDQMRELFELRVQLIPRLQKAFCRYKQTGVPPIRAVVMDYTDDPETYRLDDEYLFCEDLLVAPIAAGTGDTREVYLPAGEWKDFFTGEPVKSGRFSVTTKGIPVYVKQ